MSDDLSPAEQARAARWAADVADEAGDHGTAKFFRRRADRPAPPESVESLRAERDAEHDAWERTEDALRQCRDERDEARSDGAHWREQFRLVCDESEDRKTEIARLRATHTEAEAAWGRCKRQPRVWAEGDSAPESYIRVRDKHGQVWVWHNYRPDHGSVWRTSDGHLIGAWDWLCEHQGPLIEVLP